MADFVNKLVVIQDGKLTKVGPTDNVEIGGQLKAGTLVGDGAGVTGIAEANVVGLTSALSTLTSAASAAQLAADNAASAASAAQSTADGAVSDAAVAQSAADSAALAASGAQGTADSAVSAAAAAHADATQALANAATAEGIASGAASAASAAQSTAEGAVSDAAGAQSTADGAASAASAAQSDATQALADAASASSAASAAQGTADSALANAATAQSAADAAASAASAAQGTADTALANAASAQSTADGAVSDAAAAQSAADAAASAASAAQATADVAAGAASSAQATADAALPLAGGTLTGALVGTDLSLSGDLIVAGNIVNKGQLDVIISDSFLDINAGNVLSDGTAGGLTVNVSKAAGFTAETATAFVAGVAGVSAPSMTISSSALAAGDIVQVSGSEGGKNDGLYVVAGKAGSAVSIKGIGGTLPSAQVPFVQNQLVAGSGESASVVKVNLAVFAVSNGSLLGAGGAIPAGEWCYAYEASATESGFSGAYTSVVAVSQTLQAAYNGGAAIQLAGGSDLVVSAPVSGNAAISLDANAASHLSVAGADLTLSTSSSGDVVLDAAGIIDAKSKIMLGDSIGFVGSVDAGVGVADLLYVASDGVAKKISSAMVQELDCVALEANAGGAAASKKLASVLGAKVYVAVTGVALVGDILYVSATAGKASKVVPASGRIIKVGKVVGSAVGSNYPVIYLPQYIADV